jgi:DNA-directed RNA polymerase subunit RPC12/RpoP
MTEMLICPKCGAPLDYTPGDNPVVSCAYCGARLILSATLLHSWHEKERQSSEVESEATERRVLRRQMGGTDQAEAVAAVNEMRAHGWLMDGSLKGEFFVRANLEGADLRDVNLQGGSLRHANLHKADLSGAALQGVNLFEADLSGANLTRANLQRAEPRYANLQGANLRLADLRNAKMFAADLQGADLSGANLQGADIREALFDRQTTLPDDSGWTPDADTARFTDPEHPSFWRSSEPDSPACGA